jgi:hypothetical protein
VFQYSVLIISWKELCLPLKQLQPLLLNDLDDIIHEPAEILERRGD